MVAVSKKRSAHSLTLGASVVVLLSVLSTGSASAGSTSSTLPQHLTTTTLSTSTIARGRAYAVWLLDRQAVPSSARVAASLPTPLPATGDRGAGGVVSTAHREYLLSSLVDVETFVRAHLQKGELVEGTGTGDSPNAYPVHYVSVALTCASPHVTYCGIFYSSTGTTTGEQELRIDVEAVWLPIDHVRMPLTGVVTVTGYAKISLSEFSSGPVSVVLSRSQAVALRRAIVSLKLTGGGICMEDSQLLKIVVTRAKGGPAVWRASADECPGVLSVIGQSSQATLNDRSCALWHVVDSFFRNGEAAGTKQGAKVCAAQS